jgi:hypothetical protein
MFASLNAIRTRSTDRGGFVRVWTAVFSLLVFVAFSVALTPSLSLACACGCGVFEVATPSLLPMGAGGTVWTEWDYMDQYIDWRATTPASTGKNNDKRLETNFVSVGAQYMFNRSWGVMLEIPYWERQWKGATIGDNEGIVSHDFNSFGDIRILGMWTGWSEDMSTGLLYGLKVPSGDWHYPGFDRDTQIGTGSTDLLLGGYKMGNLPFSLMDRPFGWFLQAMYDLPVASQDHYVPGREFDGSLGVDYDFGALGPLKELAPILSILGSDRTRDQGANADYADSGYGKVTISPGVETTFKFLRVYADIEVPIFRNTDGFQIVNSYATKLIVSYDF